MKLEKELVISRFTFIFGLQNFDKTLQNQYRVAELPPNLA
jgi:hypothetical protein